MNTIIRKSVIRAGRTVVLNINRGIMSTPIFEIRVNDSLWRRPLYPTVDGKILKDSNLVDLEVDSKELDTDVGHLERSYDEYISDVKDEKRNLRKILAKKKMFKRPKAPNMLTFNEREHIRFLHKSDPNEWTVERLSQSFPALPYAIKKILKNKWKPEDLESVKILDAKVLENWEKLKKGELEAPPDVLDHLKKFINKYENLKAQLENPKFFPEPHVEKIVAWGDGPLTELLVKYEKDIEMLKNKHAERLQLITEGGEKEYMITVSQKHVSTIEEDIKRELEIRDNNGDSLIIGNPTRRDKELTLDDLKHDILKKAEENEPLSKFEETLLEKTLRVGVPERGERSHEKTNNKTKPSSSTNTIDEYHATVKTKERQTESNDFTKKEINEKVYNKNTREGERAEVTPKTEDNDLRVDDRTLFLTETEIGQFLQKLTSQELKTTEEEKPPEKVLKKPVQYYGSEKDNEMVQRDCELLSGTSFWSSNNKLRTKSKDAASLENLSINTKSNPHLSPMLKTFFTYNYPDKVKIPKDQWIKGMTYRVKDCYYDEDGEFLYRVPGMTQD